MVAPVLVCHADYPIESSQTNGRTATLMQFYTTMAPDQVSERFLWSRLEPHLDHLGHESQTALRKALNMAFQAHQGQSRKSGEPFITHPVEVTRILAEMGCELVRLRLTGRAIGSCTCVGAIALPHSLQPKLCPPARCEAAATARSYAHSYFSRFSACRRC